MLISWDQKEIIGGSKLRKCVLSSIPAESVSCSSETKHERRMAPRPKLSFRRGDCRNKDQNTEKLSWVRFPVNMVSVVWILSMTEEWRQDQSSSFRRGDYRNNRYNTENVLGSSPDEEVLCSSKTKPKRRTTPRQNLFVSERRLQELKSQTRNLSWVRVSMKILGLGINFFITFNDTWPSGRHTRWHIRIHDESPDDRRCGADTHDAIILRRWA
jgi:hypothetical protein